MHRTILVVPLIAALVSPSSAQEAAPRPGAGVTPPVLVKEVKPEYPASALGSGISGTVLLECDVEADGTVGAVRVVKPLEAALDAAAVAAVERWQFKPATKDGKPVRVRVDVEIAFTFRSRGPRLDSPHVHKVGGDVTSPRVVKDVKPLYPPAVMADGVQGAVIIELVALPDGTVGDARVRDSLHPQLDAEALRAARQWRFEPGTKAGKAVPVQVTVTMTFTLK